MIPAVNTELLQAELLQQVFNMLAHAVAQSKGCVLPGLHPMVKAVISGKSAVEYLGNLEIDDIPDTTCWEAFQKVRSY